MSDGTVIKLPPRIIPEDAKPATFQRPFMPNAAYYPGDGCEGYPVEIIRTFDNWRGSRSSYADVKLENGRTLEKVHLGQTKMGAYVA